MRQTSKNEHVHDFDVTDLEQQVADLQDRVLALENAQPPDPQPPAAWDRIIPAGSYGDLTINNENGAKRWLLEPGAIVKGFLRLAGVELLVEGAHTTSEQCHETAVQIQKGSSGVFRKHLVEHLGTPANGMGYSSVSANDDDDPAGGWAGPWTFEDGTFDQRDNGHYGFEVWGTPYIVQRNLFKGKGGKWNAAHTAHAENGFMSTPRSHDAIVANNVFDMSQGCWRVIEVAQMNRMTFVANDVLELVGDVCPMSHGGTGHTIQRNRVKGKGTTPPASSLFVWFDGTGHVVTDNRLTNVKTGYQGSVAGNTWTRNGPNDGPAW